MSSTVDCRKAFLKGMHWNFYQELKKMTANQQISSSKSTEVDRNFDLIRNNDILLVTILSLVVFLTLSSAGILLS